MGNLRPDASFEYEKHGTYTIATDGDTNERSIIGYDYSQNYESTIESMKDNQFWGTFGEKHKPMWLYNVLSTVLY